MICNNCGWEDIESDYIEDEWYNAYDDRIEVDYYCPKCQEVLHLTKRHGDIT